MIDTIVITLNHTEFRITEQGYARFSPHAAGFFRPPYIPFGGKAFVKAECNPTQQDKKSGFYFPRLTLSKAVRRQGIAVSLRVEFSAPKLLYGDNFNEVEETDLSKICETLRLRLEHYGVLVSESFDLRQTTVSAIHYGKNIPLTDHSTPSMHIQQIAKVNVNAWRHVNETGYRDGGHGIKQHTNDWELMIYDKLKDLEQAKKSEKKTFSRDNYTQLDIFEKQRLSEPFQVLRIEARYNQPKRIKALLKAINCESEPLTLERVFARSLSQKALLYEIAQLESQYPAIGRLQPETMLQLIADLRIGNPSASFGTIMQAVAYHTVLRESGTRELRTVGIEKAGAWSKFRQRMRSINVENLLPSPFKLLKDAINSFTPLKLDAHTVSEPAAGIAIRDDEYFDHAPLARRVGSTQSKKRRDDIQ